MNSNDPALANAAELLVKSVQVILDPGSLASSRAEAQKYYDNLQATAQPQELCTLGFMLSTSQSPIVVHAGLQFIKNSVCYSWNKFTEEQRASVKNMFFDLVKSKTSLSHNSMYDLPFLQEALAKVIVEIGKKEWPQLWPKLYEELAALSETSNIPFLVFRRMVEDVVSLNTVDSHDRKMELMQTLNLTASDITTLLFTIESNAIQHFLMAKQEGVETGPLERRIRLILSVIGAYFEWVNTSIILLEGRIWALAILLQVKEFRYDAAQCLLQLMERKGTKKEQEVPREFLLDICCANVLSSIASAGNEEDDVKFLKKLGEVFAILCSVTTMNSHDILNMDKYIHALATHGDIGALISATQAYNNFLRNMERQSDIPKPELASGITELIQVIVIRLTKTPKPSEKSELNQLRQLMGQILRTASKLDDRFYFTAQKWLYTCLFADSCSVTVHQWDTIAFLLDCVTSSISHEIDGVIEAGIKDIRLALDRFNNEHDLTVKSSVLSVISSLFVFLNLVREQDKFEEACLSLMNSIFSAAFDCFKLEDLSESSRFIRKHVASLMIKLGSRFPVLLTFSFEYLNLLAKGVVHKMRHVEIQGLMECLFLVSNTWKNYERQKMLIETALDLSAWGEMQKLVESPDTFLQLFEDSVFMDRKSVVSNNVSMLHAALRRVQSIPVDGKEERVHPAFDISRQLLPIVLQYVKILYVLFELPQFHYILELTDLEKMQILGITHSPMTSQRTVSTNGNSDGSLRCSTGEGDNHRTSIRKFIHSTLDFSYGILGGCCLLFAPKFYSIPQICEAYLNYVGWKLETLSDFRIRNVIRYVYRPFLLYCPPSAYETVLKPFVRAFAPFMMERLANRWNQMQEASESSDGDEDKEVLENSILRLLSREYLEIINRLLERSSPEKAQFQVAGGDDYMEMDDGMEESGTHTSTSQKQPQTGAPKELGDVGAILLANPICFRSIIHLCGFALCWDDSGVSYRAGRCILVSWEVVSQYPDVVFGVFTNCLRSICVWIENEANMDILVRLLDLIFKKFHKQDPRVVETMIQWGAPEEEIHKLASFCADGPKNDKKRKDLFRRLVRNNPNLEQNKTRKSSWLEDMPRLAAQKEGMAAEFSKSVLGNGVDLNEPISLADMFSKWQ